MAYLLPAPFSQHCQFRSKAQRFAQWLVLPVVVLLAQGCIAQFQEAVRKAGVAGPPAEETVTLSAGPGGETTAKVEKNQTPAEASKDTTVEAAPQKPGTQQTADGDPSKKLVKPKPGKDLEPPTEEELVREAVVKMGQSFEPVLNIKICHLAPKDEWWATIYQDLGQAVDVKQFIWNREQEKLEPFLVLTRIPRSKVKVHLTNNKPGSRCEILSPPWTGSGPGDKSSDLSSEFSHR